MNGSKICSIICGAPDGRLDTSLAEGLIICADRGLDHALAVGLKPDIVVGDFDSACRAVPDYAQCVRVSPIKDDTDTILAADTAIARGCTELRFFCALGGRLDHTFANVQTLEYLRRKGIAAVLYGGSEKAYLCTGNAVIERFDGFVSVFSYGERAVVSERGMKYPLDHHEITSAFPLGVSNEVIEQRGELEVHSGVALVCEYRGK